MQADVVPELLDRAARLDAPGVGKRATPVEVAGQRLDRASRAVECDHQLHTQSLAMGEFVDESPKLWNDRRAGAQLDPRREQLLDCVHMELFQTPDLALRELVVPEVDERRPAPEPDRLLKEVDLLVAVHLAGSCQQSLEQGRIDGLFADGEQIAAACGLEHVRAERSTEARHHVVQRGPRGRRSVPTPQVVDQLVDGAELTRMEEQGREERARQLASDLERTAVLDDLERSEDAEL